MLMRFDLKDMLRKEANWFHLFVGLNLIPVWAAAWFVTGDGPIHLYNARMLGDLLLNRDADFWGQFVFLNPYPDPNWFVTVAEALLLEVFSPAVAEKIVFSGYVLAFCYGFRYLATAMGAAGPSISWLGLLMVWNQIVMKGFLNNSISMAFAFWLVGAWLRWRFHLVFQKWVLLAFGALGLYFTHPMGWAFALMWTGCISVGEIPFILSQSEDPSNEWRKLLKRGVWTAGVFLPGAMLLGAFLLRQGWDSGVGGGSLALWEGFIKMTLFVSMHSDEKGFARIVSGLLAALLATGLFFRLRERRWQAFDGGLAFLAGTFLLLAVGPGAGSGGLETGFRLQFFPVLGVVLWAGSVSFPALWRRAPVWIAALAVPALLAVRLPVHLASSAYVSDMLAVANHVQPRSLLLCLNYDWQGRLPGGGPVANRNWLFLHADGYLGALRGVALAGNFEGNFGYFPLVSRSETNAYQHMAREGQHFEHRPPRADILAFEQQTRLEVNYVLVWGLSPADQTHPNYAEIAAQLSHAYRLAAASPSGNALLYERRKP